MTESQKAFVTLSVENKDLLPFLLSSFLDFYKLLGTHNFWHKSKGVDGERVSICCFNKSNHKILMMGGNIIGGHGVPLNGQLIREKRSPSIHLAGWRGYIIVTDEGLGRLNLVSKYSTWCLRANKLAVPSSNQGSRRGYSERVVKVLRSLDWGNSEDRASSELLKGR